MVIVMLDKDLSVVAAAKYKLPTKTLQDMYPVGFSETLEGQGRRAHGVIKKVKNSKMVLFEPTHPISISEGEGNQFLQAIIHAYNNHIGLRLNPDDILQCVAMAVSNCINDHSEEYRDVFVNHSGKKSLVVEANMAFNVFNWGELLEMMNSAIDENVKSSLGLEPAFTTTTRVHRSVAALTKMASFKKYFSYGLELGCGIRMVDLTGTIDDWLQLRAKVENVGKLMTRKGHMVNWSKHILSLIDHLIETYRTGNGKLSEYLKIFWSRVITRVPYGSGGQRYISGWAKVLVPGSNYDEFPEYCNLLDPTVPHPFEEDEETKTGCCGLAKRANKKKNTDRYERHDILRDWAGLTFDEPPGYVFIETKLNDHDKMSDLYCMAGFVGLEVSKDDNNGNGKGKDKGMYFVQPVQGYTVHAVAKDS